MILAISGLFSVLSGLSAGEISVEQGIVYATHDGVKLELDLARPAAEGAMRPAIVCIHGGGWRAGHRKAYAGLVRELAARGYVAVTVTYRFTQVAPWPAQLDDVRAAVRWVRANAKKYGVDPERIGVTGASAGGHLSLMLGLLPDTTKGGASPGADASVQAVVNYFGPTDMRTDVFNDAVDQMIEALAGGPRETKASVYADVSPLTHVTRTDAPVLTFQGTEDKLVPVDQARVLHKALDAAQVPNRLEILEGKGHGWGGEDIARTMREAMEFFDVHLKGSSLPLVAFEDFDAGADRWAPTDPDAWTLTSEGENRVYALVKNSKYKPKVRSPLNISLLKDVSVGDFVLDVRMKSTNKKYGHQDLCLFFGHQDPSHFYYLHLGRNADPHANSIFLVNDKPRVSIAKERTKGTDWSTGWHRVRIRRESTSGRIEVFFDDLTKPAMIAEDRTFLNGGIGVGSFDDSGNFDAIRLRGTCVEK